MAGERRHGEALNTGMDAIDAELAQLLDVEPSAEFEARVRQRAQAAPIRSTWAWTWTLAGAAAVVATVFVFISRTPDSPPAGTGPAPTLKAAAKTLPDEPPEALASVEKPPPAVARTLAPEQAPARTPRRDLDVPIVIVDAGQRVALNRMMQLVQEGKLDSKMLETPPSAALPAEAIVEVSPLTVQPLELAPILRPPVDTNAR